MLEALVSKLRPDLKDRTGLDRTAQELNVYTVLFSFPFLILGLVWLVLWTDWVLISQNALVLLLLVVTAILFRRYSFTLQFQIRPGVYASSGGSFTFLVSLSAVLIFGPSAYWVSIITNFLGFIFDFRRNRGHDARWSFVSSTSMGVASGLIATLAGYWAYTLFQGRIPLADLNWPNLFPAIMMLIVFWLVPYVFSIPLLLLLRRLPDILTEESITPRQFFMTLIIGSSLPNLAIPFTLLGAAMYTQGSAAMYLFFLVGALLASVLSSKLSENVQQRTNRVREMSTLEELGRAILVNEPNVDALAEAIEQHVGTMFYSGRHHIWLYPDRVLHQSTHFDDPNLPEIKTALASSEAEYLPAQPFESGIDGARVGVTVPIKSEDNQILGGISFNLSSASQDLENHIPTLQALAAQISSALYRYSAHEEALHNERMKSELEIAGQIQANFLPEGLPELAGYQVTASLTPARQTSGDFYDFIPFSEHKLGVLIADVADKGAGAALFMALTRTLIRTYALEYPDAPEKVIQTANQRVMEDTLSSLFVTGFYAVIDSKENTLTYVNAGHNPPYLMFDGELQPLTRTGIPLGIFEEQEWESKTVELRPGEVLVSFTDGVTEAQNSQDEEYGEERLMELLLNNQQNNAEEIQAQILSSVEGFVEHAPQFDDLTMILVKRS